MMIQSEKLEKSMPHTFADLSDADIMITDAEPGTAIRKACIANDVRLIVTKGEN